MKISVLCPSRNRPELLVKSIASLGTGDLEILVAIDDDEPQMPLYVDISKDKYVTIINMERHGYGGLHEYYNELARHAKGDWLMLFNDDATMETVGWIDIVTQHDHTIPQVLNPWSDSGDNLFPLISRKWYEVVGHFSRNTHADSWVQQIGQRLGIQVYVPGIKISHLGEDLHDTTHNEVKQIVRQTSAQYRAMEKERIEDANKIKEWYESNKRVPSL